MGAEIHKTPYTYLHNNYHSLSHVAVITCFLHIIDRYNERGNLEIQLFNIQMKLQAAKQRIWYPPEGKLISDINKVNMNDLFIRVFL